MAEQWWKDMVEVPKWAEGLMIYIGVLQDRVLQLEKNLAFVKNRHEKILLNLHLRDGVIDRLLDEQKELVQDLTTRLVLLKNGPEFQWNPHFYDDGNEKP